ncbi:hypothetical protein I317_06979 [Kwoniella heveanensis CBS 569]|nr:hypothetical protein I317_06979 [Kwoniella heveanensis CBS 569]
MPRPPETPDVRASKALAYILRHGAEKEGLHIRSDGYIKLAAVLARPKMREIDLETVLRLVSENAKQRFQLMYGYDPSPLPPKKKKVQQISKKKLRAMKDAQAQAQAQVEAHTSVEERGNAAGIKSNATTPAKLESPLADAAEIDNIQSALNKASLDPHLEAQPQPESTELPLVELPLPNPHGEDESSSDPSSSTSTASTAAAAVAGGIKGEYFIRATQGHSINLESTAHLEQITADDEAARKKVGLMVHGTRWELYETLKSQGLSRMTRQHVHLAPSFQGAIVPRPNSTLYIYLSLPKLLEAGIPVYVSHNGVVLTPGNEEGIVHREFWAKAVRKQSAKRLVVWEEGKEVEREMTEDEE